jgi:glutathione S-transferase
MSALTLYTNPMSRGRIARWMLEEIGAPYEVRYLACGAEMKSPAYRALNPMGKVPTLVHGDAVVSEVAAICAYLADTFPEARLAPETDAERARYYRWLFFAAGPVEAAVTNRSVGWEPSPELARRFGYGSYDAVVDALEFAVAGGEFIAGDRFTAADVYVGSQVGWGLQFGTLPKRDSLAAYAARATDRDAWRRAQALDDAGMKRG